MGRLYLHLGIHKTGSSAFQGWLLRNAEALEQAGIVFPADFAGSTGNATKLAHAIVLTPDRQGKLPVKMRQDFLTFCRQHADKDIIVSAEEFESELLPTVKRGAGGRVREAGAAYRKCRERLENINALVREAGLSGVTAVYLLRNAADRMSSGFAQRVKAIIHPRFDPEPFDPDLAAYHDRAACNLLMEEAGIEVAVDVMDSRSGPVASQIIRLTGLTERVEAVTDFETPRANESIGELGVIAGLHLTQVVLRGPHDDLRRRRRAMSLALRDACAGVADQPFNGFTPEDAKLVSQRQAELDQKLTPWMPAERIALMAEPKRLAPRSPISIEELDEAGAAVVRDILGRVADAMAGAQNARFGYAREEILDIRPLAPLSKADENLTPMERMNRINRVEGAPRGRTAGAKARGEPSSARQKLREERRQRRQALRIEGKGRTSAEGKSRRDG